MVATDVDDVLRDVISNNASRGDGGTLADSYTIEDDCVGANPYVVFYDNGAALLWPGAAPPAGRISTACAGVYADIRANDDVVSDAYFANIVDETVTRDQNVASDVDVVAIVTVEGCLHCGVFPSAPAMCDWRSLGG